MREAGSVPPPSPLRPLFEIEVHVYAFSMAANVLLSFFPFLIVLVSLCRHALHWSAAEQAIYLALIDYFPGATGEFLQRNLKAVVDLAGPVRWVSVLLLLFTANGIFEPLEVALNRAWGITPNRSFVRNQLVSLGLILAVGTLAILSTLLTAFNQQLWESMGYGKSHVALWTNLAIFKMAAVPISIFALFLIYWLLPNGPVPARRVFPVAIGVGGLLEILKYVNLLVWPWLRVKLSHEYGPFVNSVTIILWSFLASMIVLAGADWAARRTRPVCDKVENHVSPQ